MSRIREIWVASDNIISPLGSTSLENFNAVCDGISGLKLSTSSTLSKDPVFLGKIPDDPGISSASFPHTFTRFESLALKSILDALRDLKIKPESKRVIFVLSTTKGNIGLLENGNNSDPRISLFHSGKVIAEYFQNPNPPLIISNACISGIMALLVAKRLLKSGQYDHAIVVGADILSRFVVSGFQSLQAISPQRCKPFDKNRTGISLGEAAATMVLTTDPQGLGIEPDIKITGGGISNDANHISGPSRTGEELATAIRQALAKAGKTAADIDFISAHGTATAYNDEMEAKAFNLVEMQNTPLNSLKGYFGHTLGAAGLVESVISIFGLRNNMLISTFGFEDMGVSQPINVTRHNEKQPLRLCLKTASGFGGCNAAMVFEKVN